ncbi:putative sulfate exporter family transporter [Brevundimonas sp.]|uniref:YeiH family protein n=1 Tax=Brevundimonas sp. TaxID=1871086 RepID=UPI00185B528F|nr:putative sulfate exporter family transporter [Brevundimonas sp.]MBA4807454.1 putative sulfate exporter family transporter [Brevundimonas sp.]
MKTAAPAVVLTPPLPRPVRLSERLAAFGRAVWPGLMMSLMVALAAVGLGGLEHEAMGKAWLEPLVLAILLGAGVRTVWAPDARFRVGIDFSAKILLEVAVVLLGASVSAATLSSLGLGFVAGILALVAAAILAGFGIGRLLGLNPRMALLVACGNAICGNSAIAAVAPVIDADGEEVAASIAFTAVLGVVVVLTLPLLGGLMSMSGLQFGALAGLTVYAVPQVLAAAAPLGAVATQTGTVVKLARVLMLGPVILVLSVIFRERAAGAKGPGLHRLLPWFIVGFLAMIALRNLDLIPQAALAPMAGASGLLTVAAMAALGLQTDIRAVARAGGRVVAAVVLSLAALVGMSLGLIAVLGV